MRAPVAHIREYAAFTIVAQQSGPITPVNTPPKDLATIGSRIAWAREQRGLTQKALAAAAGVSAGTIGNAESGTRGKPRELYSIAQALSVSMEWLESNRGHWKINESNVEPSLPAEKVPMISWVQAGSWAQIVDNFQPGDADEWIPCPMRHGPHTYALLVRGISMYNPGGELSFKDGDKIFVDPDREAIHRSLVIVRLDDESESTFKQLLIEGGKRYLHALNPHWPDRIIQISGNSTICGVVIGRVESFI